MVKTLGDLLCLLNIPIYVYICSTVYGRGKQK